MLNPNPKTRLSTASFVTELESSGFWANNPVAQLVEGLDGFELKSESDKLSLLRTIQEVAGAGGIPQPFLLYRVLPSLLHSISLPTAPSGAMLPLVLELGKLVPPTEYSKLVLEPVIKLYASPDRGTRMALLNGLDEYVEKLDQRMVVEKVWPHLVRRGNKLMRLLIARSLVSPTLSQLSEKQLSRLCIPWPGRYFI